MANKQHNIDFIPGQVLKALGDENISMMKMVKDIRKKYGEDEFPTYRTFQKYMFSGKINRTALEHMAEYFGCNVWFFLDEHFTDKGEYIPGQTFYGVSRHAFFEFLKLAEREISPTVLEKLMGKKVSEADLMTWSLDKSKAEYTELFNIASNLPEGDENYAINDELYAPDLEEHLYLFCLDAIERELRKLHNDLEDMRRQQEYQKIIEEAYYGKEDEE